VTAAVNVPEFTNVVVSGVPFQFTTETAFTKFAPFTVKVKSVPPGFAETGERKVMIGTGLGTAPAAATVKAAKTATKKVRRNSSAAKTCFRTNVFEPTQTNFLKPASSNQLPQTSFLKPNFFE
jgi:hypothetical protein